MNLIVTIEEGKLIQGVTQLGITTVKIEVNTDFIFYGDGKDIYVLITFQC